MFRYNITGTVNNYKLPPRLFIAGKIQAFRMNITNEVPEFSADFSWIHPL